MRSLLMALVLGSLMAPALSANAQHHDADMRNRFGASLLLGGGGDVEYHGEVVAPIVGVIGGRADDDLDGSYGLGLSYDVPFHDYFTVGASLELLSWNTDGRGDNGVDRFTLANLGGFIKVRIPLRSGSTTIEPYARLPLGLSLNFPSNDDVDDRLNTGFGFNSGLWLGATFFVSDNIGLNAELGYRYFRVSHEVDLNGSNPDFDMTVGQGGLNLGVVFTLD